MMTILSDIVCSFVRSFVRSFVHSFVPILLIDSAFKVEIKLPTFDCHPVQCIVAYTDFAPLYLT